MTRKGEPATTVGEYRETDVGSVFVSNYPPYSAWSAQTISRAHEALASPPRPETPLGLYLHIPFCRKRCKFCYFKVFTEKNNTEVRRYLDGLSREVEILASSPVIGGRSLRFLYVGGGTPSFLSARDLRTLMSRLRSMLSFDGIEEITFECEPGTLTEPKVAAIRETGVTRLSLGVESFDDAILEENGRAHHSAEIYRAAPWITAAGFEQVNIDLIAGMVGETWESWRNSVQKTIEMDPDSVTVYQMELPYNTVYSKRVMDGDRTIPLADWDTKRAWHDHAIERLAEAGYVVSSAYTMVKPSSHGRFVYRDSVWRGCDLLGAGVASFSHVSGVHYQNASSWEAYLDALEARRLPIERAFVLDDAQRLTRETILQLKLGRLDRSYFIDKFAVDVLDRFAPAFEKLERSGMLSVANGEVRLTRQGLLRVDSLLPEFYEARYQGARYT